MNYPFGLGYFPGKLQAVAIIQTIIGGLEIIFSIFWGVYVLTLAVATFGIGLLAIPIPFLVLFVGIMSLIGGIKGLNKNPSYGLSMFVAIAQMLGLFICDVISFGCGLAALILLVQQDVKAYFR
jgi:uncharacterized membrane protein YhhN